MSDVILPHDVRDFILAYIDSIAQLEALLLLRNYPGQDWTIEAAAKRLYVSETMAGDVLTRLAADGLCICGDGSYRYHPSNAEQGITIDRLSDAYAQHLVPVTSLVHDKRTQKFVDAWSRRDK